MRKARIKAKLTEPELGDALGVSGPMISMIEDGRKALPEELVPLVRRWLATGKLPSGLELSARKNSRDA
jgi:transcriptional regulator with XRE-family HTH domain